MVLSTEPGDSAAGEAEITLINEAVTAVWSDFGVEADEKGKPRSPDRPKIMPRGYASHQVSVKDGNLYSQIVLLLVIYLALYLCLAKLYGYFCTIFSNIVASCVMIYRGVKKIDIVQA